MALDFHIMLQDIIETKIEFTKFKALGCKFLNHVYKPYEMLRDTCRHVKKWKL